MKKLVLFTTLFILSLLVAACGGPSGTPFAVQVVPADPNDPASVVNAFFIARSAFDTNASMQYVNDSSVIVSGEETFTGTADIRDFVQSRIDSNLQFTVSNAQVNGDSVTFNVEAFKNGQSVQNLSGQATVQGGIIVAMTLK
jgi:hypothetical protein